MYFSQIILNFIFQICQKWRHTLGKAFPYVHSKFLLLGTKCTKIFMSQLQVLTIYILLFYITIFILACIVLLCQVILPCTNGAVMTLHHTPPKLSLGFLSLPMNSQFHLLLLTKYFLITLQNFFN